MNLHFYRGLLWDLSRCAGLPDPHRLLETGLLRIDGCDLVLVYDESLDDGCSMQIRIDLGPPPDLERERLWRALLAANCARTAGGVCAFGVSAGADRVLMIVQQALTPDLTGSLLADGLLQAVRQAREAWAALLAAADRTGTAPGRSPTHDRR